MAVALAATLHVAPPAPAAPVVRVPFPAGAGKLTPLTFRLGYPLVTLVYDTVMWRDRRGVPRPWLARSLQTSDGGRRVVVRLRPGVRWQDGRPLTARDVAFTFESLRGSGHPRFGPQLRAIRSVRATDRSTVVFELRHRSLGFADQPLADVPVLPAHLWRSLPAGQGAPPGRPVGSGPYRVAGRRPDGGYRLVANDDYFQGRPAVDRIEIPVEREPSQMAADLRRGRLDALPFTLTPALQQEVRSLGVRIDRGTIYLGTVLMLDTRHPPFDRRAARQAVARALDPVPIARVAAGAVAATRGLLHPDSAWAPAEPVQPPAGPALADLDLPPITVLAPADDPVRREAGRQVVLQLERAGATAELRPVSRAELGRAVGESGGTPAFTAAIWSTPALASYDPDFLAALFGPGPLNLSGYRSATFDALARRVAQAATADERRRAVADELDRLAEDAPVVPLLFPRGAFGFRAATHRGWTYVAGTGIVDKRSFLREGASLPAAATPATQGGDGGPSVLVIVAIGALAVAGLLAGAATFARRP